jgi:quaternary ammonium compound-resistance protein SugE
MSWLVLVLSGGLEGVWATALGRSAGLTRLGPAAVFAVGLAGSMAGLAWALRSIPVGSGYAVWVGVGAATTAGYAMATGAEPAAPVRIALLTAIVACVAGLKLTS